ncbi:unnamed protein product [Leptidea sinapis]|uniref:Transcription factor IIIC subunit 5 HTH domain-containing protein n=1 Tax=Leptidea sinapis TaxID=189913 RepID=A0A5E4QXI0_9NEOP|nr:unnamed protein product [Leptidea sinapis]
MNETTATNTKNALSSKMYCVLFPGNVKNEEKAIQCLGGLRTISQIFSQSYKKPVHLSFQPENPYVKKIGGEKKPASGVLFKVRIRKIMNEDKTILKREVIETSAVSYVKNIVKFDALCDFQYLPVCSMGGMPKCILDDIIPPGLNDYTILEKPSPLFILPGAFTRFEKPVGYSYTDKKTYLHKDDDLSLDAGDKDDVHKTRSDRIKPSARCNFNLDEIFPTEPNAFFTKAAGEKSAASPQFKAEYETVKKMFEDRPIWSSSLVKHLTNIKEPSLRMIFPCLAYYLKTGPWRLLWVRYGYDPRKEPNARIYQTLDFRLRHTVLSRDSKTNVSKRKTVTDPSNSEDVLESAVYFEPGTVPPQRQIFYTFCDVHVPEVQEVINKEPPAGYSCHPKWGWLPSYAAEKGRDTIIKYIMQAILGDKQAEMSYEEGEGSSDSISESEDEGLNQTDASVYGEQWTETNEKKSVA